MNLTLDLQNPYQIIDIPTESKIKAWILSALQAAGWQQSSCELTIRIVDKTESQNLNKTYRNIDKPTNILSFPFEVPKEVECDLLGDLVICNAVVEEEAKQQNKLFENHWAHMVIHGTLHLLGFDHIENAEAEEMEQLEIKSLKQHDIDNPYVI